MTSADARGGREGRRGPRRPEAASGAQRVLGRLIFPALVVAYLGAFGISTRDLTFEAKAFPLIVGAIALLVTLSIVVSEVRAWWVDRTGARDGPGGWSARELWRAGGGGALAFLLTGALILASAHLGFFAALPVFLLTLLLVLGVRPWWAAVLTAAAYLAATYLFFGVLMGLRLPTG